MNPNGQPYLNDANGNTLSGGGRTNTWDSQNRLVQCVSGGNTSQYVYGADGLRRTSVVNGNPVHYALDSGMMVREMIPSGQTLIPKATYLIGPRGPEYRRDDQTQAIRWYLYDGLGSVLGEVDPAGNVTASRKYDVYGLVRAGDNGASRHKFVGSLGHTSEDETGLIYMRARWMDPSLGRFISEDPGRQTGNWYVYCPTNPTTFYDPSGCGETLGSISVGTGGSLTIGTGGAVSVEATVVGATSDTLMIEVGLVQSANTGFIPLRTMLAALRAWAGSQGITTIWFQAVAGSTAGSKLMETAVRVITAMGDKGELNNWGNFTMIYWLLQ